MPGMLNAAIKDCPVFGGKVKSVDDRRRSRRPGREEGRARRRQRGRRRRRHLVAREERARRAADRMGRRPEREGVERERSPQVLKAGLDATDAVVGNETGDVRRSAGRRAEEDRGGLFVPAPEPRDDGADERDGALDARALRGLDADAERRGGARRHVRGGGPAGRQVRGLQAAPRRRLRPARRRARLGAPGGADRQGDAGHAGQADLVARGGHDARPLPPGHAVQADGRPRRAGQRDRAAHAHLGPVDRRRHLSAEHQGRQGSGRVPGPESAGPRGVDRLHVPESADRPRDAQPARPARLLARREPEPEHDLPRVLHRRDRACHRAGSARAAPQAAWRITRSTSRCSTRWPSASAGTSRAPKGTLSRPCADDGLRQLCGGVRRGVGQRRRRR